jgi:uroporphyrinogen-III synthase
LNLLLTRPKAQAAAMSEVLERRGHSVHLAPLLQVDPLPFDGRTLGTASAIILTSANAVPALEGLDPGIRVFAVGPDTASAARAAGLSNIAAASGTAGSLLEMVRHHWRPEYGPLAYPSGRHVSVDVAGALAAQGYSCGRVEVYATSQARQLPEEAKNLLRRGQIDAVLFMSVRTADAFCGLVASTGNSEVCRRARSLSLSDKIATRLGQLPWIESLTAASPTREGILRAVDGLETGHGAEGFRPLPR